MRASHPLVDKTPSGARPDPCHVRVASALQEAALQSAKGAHDQQVEALQARMAEAAGALNAKDELKEAKYVQLF